MVKKIAFLFLGGFPSGNDKIVHAWNHFFYHADKNKYRIIVHPMGQPGAVNYDMKDINMNRSIKSNVTVLGKGMPKKHLKTSWGAASLTGATILMLQEAYKDLNVYKFSLVDNKHVPLYSFNQTYKQLIEDDLCWIHVMKTNSKDSDWRFQRIFNFLEKRVDPKIFVKQIFSKGTLDKFPPMRTSENVKSQIRELGLYSQYWTINRMFAASLFFDPTVLESYLYLYNTLPSFKLYNNEDVWLKSTNNYKANALGVSRFNTNTNFIQLQLNTRIEQYLPRNNNNFKNLPQALHFIEYTQDQFTDEFLISMIRFLIGPETFSNNIKRMQVTNLNYDQQYAKGRSSYPGTFGNFQYIDPVLKAGLSPFVFGMQPLRDSTFTQPSTWTDWSRFNVSPSNILRDLEVNSKYSWKASNILVKNAKQYDAENFKVFLITEVFKNGVKQFKPPKPATGHPLEYQVWTVGEMINAKLLIDAFTHYGYNLIADNAVETAYNIWQSYHEKSSPTILCGNIFGERDYKLAIRTGCLFVRKIESNAIDLDFLKRKMNSRTRYKNNT